MRHRNSALSRRGFVVASAAVLAGPKLWPATPSCTLVPEQEEGPFYLDTEMVRRTLTEAKPGVPLRLQVALLDAKRCLPLENAAVDIWHCDAMGVYSGFTAEAGGDSGSDVGGRGPGRGFGSPFPGGPPPGGRGRGPGGRGGPRNVDETRFLRGVQVTNRQGVVEFETVYPGWYAGRTIHIHLKVHLGGNAESEHYGGGHVSHIGQLFFPEEISAEIAQLDPYVTHRNVHRTLHGQDHVFLSQGGAQSILQMERLTKESSAGGFSAAVTLAVDPEATPAPF